MKILRLLIALKHSFKGFKGQKALFKPFDVFLMYSQAPAVSLLIRLTLVLVSSHSTGRGRWSKNPPFHSTLTWLNSGYQVIQVCGRAFLVRVRPPTQHNIDKSSKSCWTLLSIIILHDHIDRCRQAFDVLNIPPNATIKIFC